MPSANRNRSSRGFLLVSIAASRFSIDFSAKPSSDTRSMGVRW
jgi:hypothetical protein